MYTALDLRSTEMRVVTLLAQKGGTGKTSLALLLAVNAEEMGQTAAVIDIDPQATACRWYDRRLSEAPVVTDAQPVRLRHALDTAATQGVDLVVIDTPARSEAAALEAARVADFVIIPCRPQIYDIETIPAAQQILEIAGNPRAAVVLNAVPARGPRVSQARVAIKRFGFLVCPHTIGHRAAVGDAGTFGLTPTEFQPHGRAAQEARAVAHWITKQLAQTGESPHGEDSQSRRRPARSRTRREGATVAGTGDAGRARS